MKKVIVLVVLAIATTFAFGQKKYMTRTGTISFFSDATLEDIKAENNQVTAIFNSATGQFAYKVPIKSFQFQKALMQEHFNENYMESDKYPEASFEGTISDMSKVDFTKSGTYDVEVKGKLTIHNVTKDVTIKGQLVVDVAGKKVTSKSVFMVALKDYNIKNDKAGKLADDIQVTVNVEMPEKQ